MIPARAPHTFHGALCVGASGWVFDLGERFDVAGFGARLLAPLFAGQRAWCVLDGIVGLTMLALAALLATQ